MKLVGVLIILSVFVGVFVKTVKETGIIDALKIWSWSAIMSTMVIVGAFLIVKG